VLYHKTAPEYIRLDERILKIVRRSAETNKPIAAICHGAQLLAAADVIHGRRISAYPACSPEVGLCGGQYAALAMDDALTDGNFVTAPAWTISRRATITALHAHEIGNDKGRYFPHVAQPCNVVVRAAVGVLDPVNADFIAEDNTVPCFTD